MRRELPETAGARWFWVVGLAIAAALPLIVFALLDERMPNDHDNFYTERLPAAVLQHWRAEGFWPRAALILDRIYQGLHPQLSHVALLLWLVIFGVSRLSFALANLPFVIGLAIGAWGVAQRFVSRRAALALGWSVSTLPFLLCYARKRDPFFHVAALAPLGLWAALVVLDDVRAGRTRRGPWLAFVAVCLARIHCHYIALADVGLTAALLVVLAVRRAPAGPLRGTALRRGGESLALGLAGSSWALGLFDLVSSGPQWSLPRYWVWRDGIVIGPARSGFLEVMTGLVTELVQWQLMPGVLLLLILPGIVAIGLWWRRAPDLRAEMALLGVPVLLQIPIAVHTLSRGSGVVDWGFLGVTTARSAEPRSGPCCRRGPGGAGGSAGWSRWGCGPRGRR